MWTDDEELTGHRMLAHRTLGPPGGRGVPPSAAGVSGGVRCGHPLLYPVPTRDLPAVLRHRAGLGRHRYVGAIFAFDLDVLDTGRRYTGARFEVTLSGTGARAVLLAMDGDELGLVQTAEATHAASVIAGRTVTAAAGRPGLLRRLSARRDVPRAWTTGVQTASFGWLYDDPKGRSVLPRTYGMHALLEVPAEATEVAGALSVQVETDGTGGPQDGVLSDAVRFTERMTAVPAHGPAAVRLCMAADVVGYSRRRNDETEVLQRDLVDVLARARRAAGIRDADVAPQPQGDGQFTVLPVGLDESAVIPALLDELAGRLAARDRGRPARDRMQLRVALHRGLVKEGDNGWIGTAAIAVHRILDSAPLREAVRSHGAATYVLGLPDVLYRDVIVHAARPPLPAAFREMTVDLPAKGFVEHGWLHVGPEVSA
ncbi:hypothetical protein J2S43_001653 [Catenuloplanes nepalensis]|uniref:Uncharacterized protein n=1 Tax=Catenuloplanes nepalensis TaxID=587533 RepID=A0ABT9MP98_9ACTN|nr:hypothetical protein [Catenuloplanes nepalensis]MDP9793141.1 hypothetical protein [Catenuloplanes nepalensis]